MRVLSLFDGMSCDQIALKEIGITPEVYYASENLLLIFFFERYYFFS